MVADGRQVASTRMYTSLAEMWEGWTKNIYLGLKDDRGLLLLGVFGAFLAFTAALLLPAWVIWGVCLAGAGSGVEGSVVLVEAILLWGYLVYWRVLASRGMDIPVLVCVDHTDRCGRFCGHDAHFCLECFVRDGGDLEGPHVFPKAMTIDVFMNDNAIRQK